MIKKLFTAFLLILGVGIANADTSTPRLGITKPSIGSTGWGTKWNTNADTIDSGVAVQSSTNNFTAVQTFSGGVVATSYINASSGTFSSSVTVTGKLVGGAETGAGSASSNQIGYSTWTISGAKNISTTNTWQNLAQVTLEPGDWFVTAAVVCVQNTGTSTSQCKAVLSENSGNTTTDHVLGDNQFDMVAGTATYNTSINIPAWRVSTSAQKTIYIKGLTTFGGGTPQMYGKIFAWRPR